MPSTTDDFEYRPMRASLQTAPLSITKTAAQLVPTSSSTQMTPPTTPENDLRFIPRPLSPSIMLAPAGYGATAPVLSPAPPVFHNYLRAISHFDPSLAMADAGVTTELAAGDLVLVHRVHTNGWADGTVLESGARGWLPTNYCRPYDPEEMRNLLKALMTFWDLLRCASVNDRTIYGNQEFMKGIIAGVRYLLERTNSLTRESPMILNNEALRRGRKSLLSELSSLVKTAKRLQEIQRALGPPRENVDNIIDEMIIKGFRIVTNAAYFHDLFEEDRRTRIPPTVDVMDTVVEETSVPPTPPADQTSFEKEKEEASDPSQKMLPAPPASKRTSALHSANGCRPISRRVSVSNRPTSGFSHRSSMIGSSPLSRGNVVSERLNTSHDTFLSHLSSFIGRLHLQSQSRLHVATAVRTSVHSGGDLLAVIDAVAGHNSHTEDLLGDSRAAVFDHIQALVFAARDILVARRDGADSDADIVLPHENSALRIAATGCVKATGDCVAKTRWVIERIGDFDMGNEPTSLDLDLGMLDIGSEERRPQTADLVDTTDLESTASSEPPHNTHQRSAVSLDKPLPEVPREPLPVPTANPGHDSSPIVAPASDQAAAPSSMHSAMPAYRPYLPPLTKLSTSIEYHDPTALDTHSSSFDSYTASSTNSTSTFLSRNSETSLASQTSTRATTPDIAPPAPRNQPSISGLSTDSSVVEETDEVESQLLEKTFAHELIFNKEGQVAAGSLPALVERLTTHECTPDAGFISAFYLTFRLFCSPKDLANALVDRFEYVADSPHTTTPVRLRVYNVFKGWLESHWRDETDRPALGIIVPFAANRLSMVVPPAGRRLRELATRVSGEGSLVPRLVSSMGKTSTSIMQFVPADAPIPLPTITKSQLHTLQVWRQAGAHTSLVPSILDVDPVEIARQLTVRQMNIFCSILPEELLSSQWMKNGGSAAPNVKAMSALSTDLSNVVAETILYHSEIKRRAAVIKQWIKVAAALLELNNYDGLMAVICSLNSSTIARLRRTWEAISPRRREQLKSMQAVVEPSQNHKVLRGRLHDHVPPCLPFLGMYLTDLTFVDIGNPATKQLHIDGSGGGSSLDDEGANNSRGGSAGQSITLINFDKHARTAKIIGELQRFQIPYRLTELADMQEWIGAQVSRVREVDGSGNVQVSYYRKSLLLEPREVAVRTPVDMTAGNHGHGWGWMGVGKS